MQKKNNNQNVIHDRTSLRRIGFRVELEAWRKALKDGGMKIMIKRRVWKTKMRGEKTVFQEIICRKRITMKT